MRTEEQLRDRVHEILNDDRFKAPPADMQVNAPLAIVQSGLRSELKALYFAFNYSEDFRQGEEGATQSIRRYGLDNVVKDALGMPPTDDYALGFRAVTRDHLRARGTPAPSVHPIIQNLDDTAIIAEMESHRFIIDTENGPMTVYPSAAVSRAIGDLNLYFTKGKGREQ